tara:strand:+ start:257 stop:547 length:291 start_codon:yes stop_codon:yes gene_type:complete
VFENKGFYGVDKQIKRVYSLYIKLEKRVTNMGMSGYILDLEEQFDTKVETAIKQSECIDEAVAEAMKHRSLVAHMTDDEVVEYVHEGWNEIWSNYL